MNVYVTKSGSKYHRDTCRFAKGATAIDVKDSGKRASCAICKPHLPIGMLPKAKASIGPENLAPCKICKPGLGDLKRDSLGAFKATEKGHCYHKDTCGTLKPKVRKAVAKPIGAPPKGAVKPIKPIKKNGAAIDASVMAALGI